jgi:2-amino-4-hydroxy-6-hydroxymethyldihydropteridine diphosphokinase
MAKVYFSTGSNQGDRLSSLVTAAKLIDILIGKLIAFSPVVESEPLGFEAETNFYNQVLIAETELTPRQIIETIFEIEHKIGRVRIGSGFSSRIIDIDILFYEDMRFDEVGLIIPHPRMHMRKFVLQPLASLAPEHIHPVFGKTISELLLLTEDNSHVELIVEKDKFGQMLEDLT